MGFTFISGSVSTDKVMRTEVHDYGNINYPVALEVGMSTGDGWVLQRFSFYTRQVARETLTALRDECNRWLDTQTWDDDRDIEPDISQVMP